MLNYKCLILDHDDTIFDSTRTVHYPAFIETLTTLRPDQKDLPFNDFITMCHTLGFEKICDDVYHFDADELKTEYAIWKNYTGKTIPDPFKGIGSILKDFVAQGGKIAVVSHSESAEIKRDYLTHFGFEPDLIFGWELGSSLRKPNPYPLNQTLSILNLQPQDCLVVDDMRLGKEMAQALDVDFACAAWAHQNPVIMADMKDSGFYLESIEDLRKIIFT
jgi:beta-phosphoglucomutase-like phosphatase (HAD superfamily)